MQVLIRDLAPGTRYRLQIRSKNSVGQTSNWSKVLDFNTITDNVAPGPVNNLQAEVKPRGSFQVKWDAPTVDALGQPLYDLKDYVVVVSSIGSTYTNTYATSSTTWDFTFEMNYGAFIAARPQVTFTVYARDLAGNLSTPSTAYATNQPPSNVSGFVATGSVDSISFNWDKNTDIEDDIAYYLIKQGNSPATVVNSIYQGLTIPATWETIDTALQYFSIVAVDLFAQASPTPQTSSARARSSLTVDVTPPGIPTAVATTSGVDTSDTSASSVYINVTWTPPIDTDIQEYVIRYSIDGTTWNYMVVPGENTSGAQTTTARINGLRAGQSYYVAVQAVDYTANFSAFTNSSTYPQTTAKDTTAPSTPAAPSVAVNQGGTQIQVSHGLLKAAGGNLETDTHHLETYASTTTNFTPSATNKLGDIVIVAPPATGTPITAVQNFTVIPTGGSSTQTWYVKVIAVDNAGNKSSASAQNSGNVPLLSAIAIADATITSAKINDVQANLITAGTGFINAMTVRSTFTLGDASTNGIMQSYDYTVGGPTGWRLEKGALAINSGTINARALNLQDGENILHPAYSDFEFAPTWYTGKLTTANGATASIQAGVIRTNLQALQSTNGATANGTVHLTPALTTYNIIGDPVVTYIISAYVRQESGSNKTAYITAKDSTGAVASAMTPVVIPSGAWTRIWRTYAISGSATAFNIGLVGVEASTSFYWDSIQLERQLAGSSNPSVWSPYSRTFVDGGNITTGSIQSSASADGVAGQPAWSINTAGNMQVGNANVRGTLYVGPPGSTTQEIADRPNSKVRSAVYTPGSGGWQITGDGTAEFNQVTVRGAVYATSGNFSNQIIMGTANTSAHYMRSFNYSAGSAGWIIQADGNMEFNNGTFRGAVTGATITGGIIQTAASGARTVLSSAAYNKILFYPGLGEDQPADIRVSESAADRYIQIYSPAWNGYGGNRAHISVGAQAFGGNTEIDLIAPGGTIYFSASDIRFAGTSVYSDNAFVAGNGAGGTYRIAIGSFSGSEGFIQGLGTSNTGIRLGTDSYVRVVTADGNSYTGLAAGNTSINGSINISGYLDVSSMPQAGGVPVYLNGTRLGRQSSTIRFKTDVSSIDIDANKVLALEPKTWLPKEGYGDTSSRYLGLIAEHVEKAIPHSVYYDEDGEVENYYDRAVLAGLLVVIKQMDARIKELELRL